MAKRKRKGWGLAMTPAQVDWRILELLEEGDWLTSACIADAVLHRRAEAWERWRVSGRIEALRSARIITHRERPGGWLYSIAGVTADA